MARIDFYILPDTTLEARLQFACKLAETIWRKGYRLHLHCEDRALAEQADSALWNFRPDAYLPHALEDSEMATSVPRSSISTNKCWSPNAPAGSVIKRWVMRLCRISWGRQP